MRYFGYGSNLNFIDFERYCANQGYKLPQMNPVITGFAPDYELGFNFKSNGRNGGVLNIRAQVGSIVEGILFDLDQYAWEILDLKEGFPTVYQKKEIVVLKSDGSAEPAYTYVINQERYVDFVEPHPDYLSVVSDGLISHGLGIEALLQAAKNQKIKTSVPGFFVYGTLLSGLRNHGVIAKSGLTQCVPTRCNGTLLDTGAGYPVMIFSDLMQDSILGEYIVPNNFENAIHSVDQLEGFSGYLAQENLYDRRLIQVNVNGQKINAWTYVYKNSVNHFKKISSGDWRSHVV